MHNKIKKNRKKWEKIKIKTKKFKYHKYSKNGRWIRFVEKMQNQKEWLMERKIYTVSLKD